MYCKCGPMLSYLSMGPGEGTIKQCMWSDLFSPPFSFLACGHLGPCVIQPLGPQAFPPPPAALTAHRRSKQDDMYLSCHCNPHWYHYCANLVGQELDRGITNILATSRGHDEQHVQTNQKHNILDDHLSIQDVVGANLCQCTLKLRGQLVGPCFDVRSGR